MQGLLTAVDDSVAAHGGSRAVRIVVEIPDRASPLEDLLREEFEDHKHGSAADHAELIVHRAPVPAACLDCGTATTFGAAAPEQCPSCGGTQLVFTPIADLRLISVEVEE